MSFTERRKPPRLALRGECWGVSEYSESRMAPSPALCADLPRKRGEVKAGLLARSTSRLQIQALVAAEDAVLVKGDAALAREIRLDVRPGRNAVV